MRRLVGSLVCLLLVGTLVVVPQGDAAESANRVGDWEISVVEVHRRDSIRSGPSTAFGEYMVMYLDVTYVGTSRHAVGFSPAQLRLIDSNGNTLAPDLAASLDIQLAEFISLGEDDRALPGESFSAVVVFDVPKGRDGRTLTSTDGSLRVELHGGAATASPVAEPVWALNPLLYGRSAGLREGVGRSFVASNLNVGKITFLFSFFALQYDSTNDAANALSEIIDLVLGEQSLRFEGVPETSRSVLGDEAVAQRRTATLENPTIDVDVTIVAVRDDNILRLAFGFAIAGGSAVDIVAILERAGGSQPGPSPVVYDGNHQLTGELWDCLPGLADLPWGYVRVQDFEVI